MKLISTLLLTAIFFAGINIQAQEIPSQDKIVQDMDYLMKMHKKNTASASYIIEIAKKGILSI